MKKALLILPFAALTLIVVLVSFSVIMDTNTDFIQTSASGVDDVVLIIDPGHGGRDGGAVSPNNVIESAINLDISLKFRDICTLFGVSPVMTRESEDIKYPEEADTISKMKIADQKARVKLINSYDNAFLISIHQNTFPSSKPSGVQVLYKDTGNSKEFAEMLQLSLSGILGTGKNRTASKIPNEIYLLKNINCPAVLIECGFLSNPNDEKKLTDPVYQLKYALYISSAFFDQYTGNYRTNVEVLS